MSKTLAAVLALAVGVAPAAALAESSPARDALKRACTGDYMELCSAYSPGGPEVEACFRANMKNLSSDCASAITAYKREQKSTRRVSEAR
ncbi:hypothetical protein [Methylobacterium sp. J-076]|uniref:hypothetical protein n=1 Tax=Methylobacterium sp. J-076 TaxID=2836655 RepID=UPI001FB981A6|nr:hypothetical protein [Methylobacterium sp. J-076]MCJ2012123.1 hypothetical protein [Methylobacterium sp. J-076]